MFVDGFKNLKQIAKVLHCHNNKNGRCYQSVKLLIEGGDYKDEIVLI